MIERATDAPQQSCYFFDGVQWQLGVSNVAKCIEVEELGGYTRSVFTGVCIDPDRFVTIQDPDGEMHPLPQYCATSSELAIGENNTVELHLNDSDTLVEELGPAVLQPQPIIYTESTPVLQKPSETVTPTQTVSLPNLPLNEIPVEQPLVSYPFAYWGITFVLYIVIKSQLKRFV